jgi:hypothetical protein
MGYLIWIIITVVFSLLIWWIMDWHDKHEDGE